MKIIAEEELATRVDFRRPLHPPPDPPESPWCIPFEFGGCPKGTRISIAKAKEIAAELRASVAEAELRQVRKAYADEVERNIDLCAQYSAASDQRLAALQEVAELKQKLRSRRKTLQRRGASR